MELLTGSCFLFATGGFAGGGCALDLLGDMRLGVTGVFGADLTAFLLLPIPKGMVLDRIKPLLFVGSASVSILIGELKRTDFTLRKRGVSFVCSVTIGSMMDSIGRREP